MQEYVEIQKLPKKVNQQQESQKVRKSNLFRYRHMTLNIKCGVQQNKFLDKMYVKLFVVTDVI